MHTREEFFGRRRQIPLMFEKQTSSTKRTAVPPMRHLARTTGCGIGSNVTAGHEAQQNWRNVALDGDAAIDWLSDQGWTTSGADGPFRIFADLVQSGPFAVGRIWHSAADLRLDADGGSEGRQFVALLGIEGTQTLHTDTGLHSLTAGTVYVQDLDEPLTISASTAAARIVFTGSWDRLYTHRSTLPPRWSAWNPDPDYFRVIVSLTNAILGVEIETQGPGFWGVQRSFEALISGLLLQRELTSLLNASSREVELLQRAIAEIDRSSSDPSFTVEHLAERLGVSRAYLHQAFSTTGVTAARRLRHARAVAARVLLADSSVTSESELKRIADAAGFRSVRTMQRTLLREQHP